MNRPQPESPGTPRRVGHAAPTPTPNRLDETMVQPPKIGTSSPLRGFGAPEELGEVGTLGPYRILRQLGMGAMGAVFVAVDTRLDRKLALKVMLPEFADDRKAKQRFLREARAAAKIDHDNVVTIYEADEYKGVPFIAMQLLQGFPLDEFLRRKGRPGLPELLKMGWETADGLAAAHEHGLIHRDIKPANLWLEMPNHRIKVLDFGLAKPIEADASASLSQSGVSIGTPAYMSPEQANGDELDHRSDLFSLGVVLYELSTGQLPFAGQTTMEIVVALTTDHPPPIRKINPELPEALTRLIHQLLEKQPSARPQAAEEVARRLREIDQELLSGSFIIRGPGRTATPSIKLMLPAQEPVQNSKQSENPLFGLLNIVLATLIVAAITFLILQGVQRPAPEATPPESILKISP